MGRNARIAALCIALSIVSSAAGAQILGIPDDVPARRVMLPFFNLEVEGTDDFLVCLANTLNSEITVHAQIYDRETEHVYNFNIEFTSFDLESLSLRQTINSMGAALRSRLVVEEDGKSYYRGEVLFEVSVPPPVVGQPYPFLDNLGNVLLCYVYWIDLALASSVGFNGLHIQYGWVPDVFVFDDPDTPDVVEEINRIIDTDGYECFSADALSDIYEYLRTGTVTFEKRNNFDFYFRYFIPVTEGSEATLIVWTSAVDEEYGISMLVYDEEENAVSSGIYAPYQVMVVPLSTVVPPGFLNADGHKAGWVRAFSDNRPTLMWVRERMVDAQGRVFDSFRSVPRELDPIEQGALDEMSE